MKKSLSLIVLAVALLLPATAAAVDFTVDGINYRTSGTNATVSGSDLTVVNIPATVTYNGTTYTVTAIGSNAFYGCTGMTSVTIPNSVTNIESNAFERCSKLTSVTIPNSVTTIGMYAFCNCQSLQSVTIPNSVTNIKYGTFLGCNGMTSVNIGNSVTTIGDEAFMNCSHLTSVSIPNSVTTIGTYAFQGCSYLTSLTIGSSVTTIGDNAFNYCSLLTSVTSLRPEAVSLPFNAFSDPTFNTATLYVPVGSSDSYAQTDYWSRFLNIVEMEPTASPSISITAGEQVYYLNITAAASDADADLYYRVQLDGGDWSDWMPYDGTVTFSDFGTYMVEAYAIADGKTASRSVFVSFTLNENTTAVDELTAGKTVASTRYFNMAGQEMREAKGICIAVTTYTDGTTSAVKVVK